MCVCVCAYDQISDAVLGACFTSDPTWKVACETRGEDTMVWAVCVITVGYEADTSDSFSPDGAVDVCYGTTSSPIREPVWLVIGPTTDAKSGAPLPTCRPPSWPAKSTPLSASARRFRRGPFFGKQIWTACRSVTQQSEPRTTPLLTGEPAF